MRKYRRYTNVHHGKHYNPDTQAHHVQAEDYPSAAKQLPWTMGAAGATQVMVAGKWEWVTETHELFGGTKRDFN